MVRLAWVLTPLLAAACAAAPSRGISAQDETFEFGGRCDGDGHILFTWNNTDGSFRIDLRLENTGAVCPLTLWWRIRGTSAVRDVVTAEPRETRRGTFEVPAGTDIEVGISCPEAQGHPPCSGRVTVWYR